MADTVPTAEPIVSIEAGAIRGVTLDGALRFMGVPYAAPPVGDLRFALPQKHASWSETRDAKVAGPIAPQPAPTPEEIEKALPGLDIAPLVGDGWKGGDDYLLANIWTPDTTGRAPVMVFIHGGSFTGGAASAEIYDGTAFARAGIVCVTISYRCGIEGFLPIPGAPTNLGIRDALFALKWVQDNIAAFGGDAGNVTVFGESAGAMMIANMVASPLTKGLMHRAIIQSGHGDMVRPIPVAQRLVNKVAKILRVKPTLEGFKSRSVAECVAALVKVSKPTTRVNLKNEEGREPAFGLSKFLPVYGDDVLPEPPLVALSKGVGAEIQVLIGTNREEMNLYFVPSGVKRKIGKFLANLVVKAAEPQGKDILRAYGINERGKRPGDTFTEALTDLVFALPARRFAQAHQGQTHFYEFQWRSPMYDNALGAAHGMELPFVFDTLKCVTGARGLVGTNPPQDLATRVNKIWADFAKTGTLPWPAYDKATRLVCVPETGAVGPDREMPAARFLPL